MSSSSAVTLPLPAIWLTPFIASPIEMSLAPRVRPNCVNASNTLLAPDNPIAGLADAMKDV